jgi:cysteine-rich repeat protein
MAALLLALGVPAGAALDPSGTWVTDLPSAPGFPGPGFRLLVLRAEGAAVDARLQYFGQATGTWDPATRTLRVGDPSYRGSGSGLDACGGLRIDAVMSPDGAMLTGDETTVDGLSASKGQTICFWDTHTFTARRATCGNGQLDPGESCDPGEVLRPGDCCSIECRFESRGYPCRTGEGDYCDTRGTCLGNGACEPVDPDDLDPGVPDPCRPPPGPCGNGVVDRGESCDPTVPRAGDCCSDTCTFEAAGHPCVAGTSEGAMCDLPGTCIGNEVCVPDVDLDVDVDGVPDPCDACIGGAPLPSVRKRIHRGALVLSARVQRGPNADPAIDGLLVSLTGTATPERSIALPPGEAITRGGPGWTAHPSKRWVWASADAMVTAAVHVGRRSAVLRLVDRTPDTVTAAKRARFVAVRWGTSASPVSICAQSDLTSADCAAHGRAVVCRSR